jgi:CCR4-NOT transcription complex subunit 4
LGEVQGIASRACTRPSAAFGFALNPLLIDGIEKQSRNKKEEPFTILNTSISMSDSDEDEVCPLCVEEIDVSDRNFLPCPCGYKVCMWCWHHIKENLNGLCPACRTKYSDDPHAFSTVDRNEVVKRKQERKLKEKQERAQIEARMAPAAAAAAVASRSAPNGTIDRKHLRNFRVVQRNLVYVIGLPSNPGNEEQFRKPDFFGQYGKISKVVVHKSTNSAHPTVSAYVTFAHKEDANAAIEALEGVWVEGHQLRASFGTTKYCNNFIRGAVCGNPECVYLHDLGKEGDRFTKEEIQAGHSKLVPIPGQGQTLVTGNGGPSGSGKVPVGLPLLPPPVFIQDVVQPPQRSQSAHSPMNVNGQVSASSGIIGSGSTWGSSGAYPLGRSVSNESVPKQLQQQSPSQQQPQQQQQQQQKPHMEIQKQEEKEEGNEGDVEEKEKKNQRKQQQNEGTRDQVDNGAAKDNNLEKKSDMDYKGRQKHLMQILEMMNQPQKAEASGQPSELPSTKIQVHTEEEYNARQQGSFSVGKDSSKGERIGGRSVSAAAATQVQEANRSAASSFGEQMGDTSSFNGLCRCAVFPVPISSLTISVWAQLLEIASPDLRVNPYGEIEVPISELLELTLPPVDAVVINPWPKPSSYYMRKTSSALLKGSVEAGLVNESPTLAIGPKPSGEIDLLKAMFPSVNISKRSG